MNRTCTCRRRIFIVTRQHPLVIKSHILLSCQKSITYYIEINLEFRGRWWRFNFYFFCSIRLKKTKICQHSVHRPSIWNIQESIWWDRTGRRESKVCFSIDWILILMFKGDTGDPDYSYPLQYRWGTSQENDRQPSPLFLYINFVHSAFFPNPFYARYFKYHK